MVIMGLEDEFKEAREFVEEELSLAPDRDQINLFECTIRVLGGFLSTYHLTKYVPLSFSVPGRVLYHSSLFTNFQ